MENFWSLAEARDSRAPTSASSRSTCSGILDDRPSGSTTQGTDATPPAGPFVRVLRSIVGRRLTYKALIGHLDDAGQTA